ncbi:MAG TPA: FCD domain-containing protein [Devosia sp.]|jgi:DNA-binding FadR family transcriptional regulator|nr:FCD domain-containing protein [Devosia sp.]
MSELDPVDPPAPVAQPRRKRTDEIVDAIKRMIVEHGLGPGDRLPQERDLILQFAAGKGTVREALKALEVQGLISVRTGPGGGAFIERMSEGRAMSLLSNFLFAKNLSIANIYEMRKVLEPQLAASATPQIDEAGLNRLEAIITIYDHEPADHNERWTQRMAELDFHGVVAEYSDNPILAFTCRFLQRLLKDLTIAQDIYVQPEPVLRASGIRHQRDLIAAMRRRDAAAAAAILAEHMQEAEKHMLDLQARLMDRFLTEDSPARTRKRRSP